MGMRICFGLLLDVPRCPYFFSIYLFKVCCLVSHGLSTLLRRVVKCMYMLHTNVRADIPKAFVHVCMHACTCMYSYLCDLFSWNFR